MNYEEALDWLFSTQHFGIKLGLDAPRRLLTKYLACPAPEAKVIHVAGTNGKGSTCAFIESLARNAGKRTGLFTSPHLVDYRERVQVNGIQISREDTLRHLIKLKPICEKIALETHAHPTFFEITLALAMRHFRDSECEYIILETGMGGRLDATTAVDADTCVITPIALDHTQWLGNSLEEIASEKAGIILDKTPLIVGMQPPEALTVIEQKANEKRAPLKIVDEPLSGYTLSLPGEHQKYNAALAVETVHSLDITLTYEIVKQALSKTSWPARFQIIDSERPLVVDGAHNPHAASILVDTWKKHFPNTTARVIIGSTNTKDFKGTLSILKEIADGFIFTPIHSARATTSEEFESIAAELGIKANTKNTLAEAYQSVDDDDFVPILITGSLHLAGEFLAMQQKAKHRITSQ